MSWSKGDHLVPTGTPMTSQQMSFNSGPKQVKITKFHPTEQICQ